MRDTFLKPLFDTVRYWYIPAIVGVFFIIAAIFAFTSPAISFYTLAILFSLSFLFSGISEIIFSVSNAKTLSNWGWHLMMGILTLVVGLLLLRDPGLSTAVLALYIGFTVLFRAIGTISFSIDLKNYGMKNWSYMLIFGILGILAAVLLILNPGIAGLSLVFLMGFSFLVIGIFRIFFAFQLRKIHRYSKKIKPALREKYLRLQEEILAELEDLDS